MVETRTPPMTPSSESTAHQIGLGRKQGDALTAAVRAKNEEAGTDIQRAGDYEIILTVEPAEGLYHWRDTGLVWEEPGDENAHVEVVVRDAADGRFVPGLTVTVTLTGQDGREVGTWQQPFIWHPWLYHYGRNWQIPGEGDYKVHIHVGTPTFLRHDHANGKRYGEPVDVEITRHIVPSQKHAV